MLRRVATCWMLLAQIWRLPNFSRNICGCCMMLWLFGQVRATMLHPGMLSFQLATCRNIVAKRTPHVAPNNVAICCAEMLRSFSWGLQIVGQQCCVELLWSFGRGFKFEPTTPNMSQHLSTLWPNAFNMLRSFGQGLRRLERVFRCCNVCETMEDYKEG